MKILGLNITRQRKESPTWGTVLSFLRGQQVVYTPADYGTIVKAGYQQCAPVFSVVSLIARAASRISWYVQRGRGDQAREVEDHELQRRLLRPNEYQSGSQFVEAVLTYKLLAGNAYIHRVGIGNQPPQFLYTYRPDRMAVKPGDGKALVGGYTYTVNGQAVQLKAEEVLHLKDFHPLHDFYGLSRLEVAAKLVDTTNWIHEWNLKLMQNDMRPPGMLTMKGPLTDDQFARVEAMVKEKYQGASNAGKLLLLHGNADFDFKELAVNPRDMDWLGAEKYNLRAICSVFNVPSELLGDSENKTYSNVQEARRALYMETVLPEMDQLRDALNGWLAPLYGADIRLDYDRDAIEALQEDRERKYSYLDGARFLSTNEKRTACGYDELGPEGDEVLVGMGDMALSDAVASAGDLSAIDKSFRPLPAALRKGKSLGGFWRGDTERKALWRNYERRITSKERAFIRELQGFLEGQARSAVAKLKKDGAAASDLLDRGEAVDAYKAKFKGRYARLFISAVEAGRRLTEGKLYEPGDEDKADLPELTPELRKKLERLIEEAAEVITDETLAEIQSVLRSAYGTNMTVQEIANALKEKLLNQMSPVRARRIARTETGMLENCGNLDGFKENEYVNKKGWLCSFVEDSRDAHIEADGQEVGIDDEFRVGGDRLAYPLDRSGGASAGNVINCLCAMYPVVE